MSATIVSGVRRLGFRVPRIGSAVSPAHNVSELPVIHCGVDAIDVLVLYVLMRGQNRLPSMPNAAKFNSV
jgi:hypothetical protein